MAGRVRRHRFLDDGGNELPAVTVSVGIAARDAELRDAEALVRRADENLYRAKEQGRDRCVADATPVAG